jgi:hypothetical protein
MSVRNSEQPTKARADEDGATVEIFFTASDTFLSLNDLSESDVGDYAIVQPTYRVAPIDSQSVVASAATVTRVVGNSLVYVVTEDGGPLVFTPDNISGYEGQPLKEIGIREGTKVDVQVGPWGQSLSAPKERKSGV